MSVTWIWTWARVCALMVLAATPVAFGQPAAAPSPSVRAVAHDPAAHLGNLTLEGVVGIVTPQKGFVLVDMDEYRAEGLSCLTTAEKTKMPVAWKGPAPEVKETVHVEGTLAKSADGYVFTASKVTP